MKLLLLRCIQIIVLCILLKDLSAQSIGISSGINFTKFNSTLEHNYINIQSSLPSYCFNFSYDKRDKAAFKTIFEVSIVGRSFTYVPIMECAVGLDPMPKGDYTYNLNANYVYVSYFPQYTFGKNVKFNIGLGPSIGFLFNSRIEKTFTSYTNGKKEEFSSKGLMFGSFEELRFFGMAGIEIPCNSLFSISFDGAYSSGILRLCPDNGVEQSNDFNLALGIKMKL